MATKDWRRVNHDSSHIVFINKKTDDKIRVAVNPIGRHDENVWEFIVYNGNEHFKEEYNLSKSQALSFAKKYMRTH